MDTNKMREQFEAWALTEGLSLNTRYGTYFLATTEKAWRSWKASRAAVVVELPREPYVGQGFSQPSYGDALKDCRAAIEAQGLKVAP